MTATVLGMAMVLGFGMTRVHVETHDAPTVAQATSDAAVTRSIPAVAKAIMSGRELECLASAIWYEAGNQTDEGRVAVAEVVLSRMKSKLYPNRACAVIAQRSQFSFVHGGIIPTVPSEQAREMRRLAVAVAEGRRSSRTKGALWFHATYKDPRWALPRLGRIGSHIFYGTRG